MSVPVLTTPRLLLRPFTLADLHPLFDILQEPDIFKYFPRPGPPPLEKVERIINEQLVQYEQYSFGQWAVEVREKPGLVGWCGLNHLPDTNEDEVAYLLNRSARRPAWSTVSGPPAWNTSSPSSTRITLPPAAWPKRSA